jgi:hypothetical protein
MPENTIFFAAPLASGVATCAAVLVMLTGWYIYRQVAQRSRFVANAVYVILGSVVALGSQGLVYEVANWAPNRGNTNPLNHTWVHPGPLWSSVPMVVALASVAYVLLRNSAARRGSAA